MAKYIKTEDGYKGVEDIDIYTKMDKVNPIGTGSFSMNRKSGTTVGDYSHAEGYYTEASGQYSHAEGFYSTASGEVSHAEGTNTIASGKESHAEGSWTTASGPDSHAEGYSTKASGYTSHAEGYDTVASNVGSHAEGNTTHASGKYSHAEGYYTTASGEYSHAEGQATTASGPDSHAEGYSDNQKPSSLTALSSNDDIIEAWYTTNFSWARGTASHVEGLNNLALDTASHAEGQNTKASNYASHAEGASTTASGRISHAEGYVTKASGEDSHAEGFYSTASGHHSHAEGYYTVASGMQSHAEGSYTTASGPDSHAEGYNTKASGNNQHAQGKHNVEDSASKYAHIVGNGTSDTARSNAHTLDWNGNAWYQGDVYVGSTSGKNKDQGSKKLATETYVNQTILNQAEEAFATINNSMSSLAPGAITWNRDLKGRTIFQAGEQNGFKYGFVKVSDTVFTPEQFQLLLYSGFKPTLGAWVEDKYISWEAEIQKIDESLNIGYIVLPEDESEQLGAILLSSDFMGLTAGIYFAIVEDLGYVVAAVTNLQIPGYGHSEEEDIGFELQQIPKLTNTFKLEDILSTQVEMDDSSSSLGLGLEYKYFGNYVIPYEQLLNTNIYCVTSNGTILIDCDIDKNDSYVTIDFGSIAFLMVYEDTQYSDSVLLAPGLYLFGLTIQGITLNDFVSITFEEKVFDIKKNKMVLPKENLPIELQFGEVDQAEYLTFTTGTPQPLEGDILYRKEENGTPISLFASGIKCRVADAKSIPDDVKIIVTISDSSETRHATCEGVLNNTKDAVKINWDEQWDDGTTAYYANGATVATIEKNGIYLQDHDYPLGAGFIFKTQSVQFEGMSFTYTEYTTETVKETEFKKLDKQYLPDISFNDLIDKPIDSNLQANTLLYVNGNKKIASLLDPKFNLEKIAETLTKAKETEIAIKSLSPGGLSWDGQLEDRYCQLAESLYGIEIYDVLVTEEVPSAQFLQLLKNNIGEYIPVSITKFDMISDLIAGNESISCKTTSEDLSVHIFEDGYVEGDSFYIVPYDNYNERFPKKGIYVIAMYLMGLPVFWPGYISIPGYTFSENVIKKVNVSNNTTVLTWNPNDTFIGGVDNNIGLNYIASRVGEPIPKEALIAENLTMFSTLYPDDPCYPLSIQVNEEEGTARIYANFILNQILIVYENSSEEIGPGTYFIHWQTNEAEIGPQSLYLNGTNVTATTLEKKIKNSLLPEYLQLGESIAKKPILKTKIVKIDSKLLYDESREQRTGDMIRECRVADYIDLTNYTITCDIGGVTYPVTIRNNTLIGNDITIGYIYATYTNGHKPGIYLERLNFAVNSITVEGIEFTRTDIYLDYEEVEEFKTLDAKYLPGEVATVPVAQVGQTIVVSEVDENGKPLAWEATTPSAVQLIIWEDGD